MNRLNYTRPVGGGGSVEDQRKKRDGKTPDPKPENLTPTPERKMGKRREQEERKREKGRRTPALPPHRPRHTSLALGPPSGLQRFDSSSNKPIVLRDSVRQSTVATGALET